MRKFKHKLKDITLVKCKNGNSYSSENWEGYYIPSEFVENSSDWEEIKKCLFITEDGVEIFEELELIWDTSDINWNFLDTTPAIHMKSIIKTCSYRKAWAKKENAERYIELNSPKYSIKEVVSIVNNWSMCRIDEDNILNFLAKSENNNV